MERPLPEPVAEGRGGGGHGPLGCQQGTVSNQVAGCTWILKMLKNARR